MPARPLPVLPLVLLLALWLAGGAFHAARAERNIYVSAQGDDGNDGWTWVERERTWARVVAKQLEGYATLQ
jgi:hypothetical protein